MAQRTAQAPASTKAGPSPKQQFLDVYNKEHTTTRRVLDALPAEKSGYKPHEKSRSALDLAWTFVIENNVAVAALRGQWKMPPEFPPAPATFGEVIEAYEAGAKEMVKTLTAIPDAKLFESVAFFTGPKQVGEVPIIDVLWFMLMDSVHHRGQFSVYLRLAGGKVPSIYGPSLDEPWM
jgi:uncharacterized damage-inducible protein DinB